MAQEDKKEPWLNYLALTTVILAVCATLATFKVGGYSTRSVLVQNQASDQWAYFQAKSIKQSLAEMEQGELQRELARGDQRIAAETQAGIQAVKARIAKYDQEKARIQEDAKKFEKQRDDAQRHGRPFGLAVIFLQIAILLSSIAALLKQKPVWLIGVAVGVCGLVQFANGFLLFM